jgi:hypothetical protein
MAIGRPEGEGSVPHDLAELRIMFGRLKEEK